MKRFTRSKPEWAIKLYNSGIWRKKRAHILKRDHYLCQSGKLWGGKPCGKLAAEVHHIKELVDFPELALDDDNLISLCRECHEKTKKKSMKRAPSGVRVIKA